MNYRSVSLTNFRNYEESTFRFHEKVNLFVGQNAVGKTNLLESLYVTSYGRSFRTVKDKELIRFGEDFCRIRGTFTREEDGDEEHTIDIRFDQSGERKGSVDGIGFEKYSDIFDHVLAVIFSPEDLKVIKESPEKRREFIDRELGRLSLAYYRDLLVYRRILQQRNAYLKEDDPDTGVLSVWDDHLIQYGSRIIFARNRFIQKLEDICHSIHSDLTGGKEKISLLYRSNIPFDPKKEDLASLENTFREVFKESLETDLKLRYTTKGPQKDDLEVLLNEISGRTFASQGQQRTAALSLKLSEIALIKEEKGEYPILLLDDVLSELDQNRQSDLIHALDHVQLFITATEIPPFVEEHLPDHSVICLP